MHHARQIPCSSLEVWGFTYPASNSLQSESVRARARTGANLTMSFALLPRMVRYHENVQVLIQKD